MKWPQFFRFYVAVLLVFSVAIGTGALFLRLKTEKGFDFVEKAKGVLHEIPAKLRAFPSFVLKVSRRFAAFARETLRFLKTSSTNPEASLEASGLKGKY